MGARLAVDCRRCDRRDVATTHPGSAQRGYVSRFGRRRRTRCGRGMQNPAAPWVLRSDERHHAVSRPRRLRFGPALERATPVVLFSARIRCWSMGD